MSINRLLSGMLARTLVGYKRENRDHALITYVQRNLPSSM
jgi:hypothetical protein